MIFIKATPSMILASLLVGIIVGVALSSWLSGWAILIGGVVIIDLTFVIARKAPWRDRMWLIGLLTIGMIIGVWRYSLTTPGVDSVIHFTGSSRSISGTTVKYEGDVGSQHLTLDDLIVDGQPVTDRALVFTPGYPKVKMGEAVSLECQLDAPEPFEGFAYDRWLATQDVHATCFAREVPFVTAEPSSALTFFDIRLGLNRLHESATGVIDRTFGEPQAALLAGLLMGDNNFSDEWKDHFLHTGTSHVVAASGYNVSMLAFVLFAILISLGLKRQYAFPFVLIGIACFVTIAGAGGAVTRAGIMGALALSATQLGRKTTPRNIILLTVVIMLLDEPRLLRDDVGFQLSVMSTVGLVLMAKYFSEKFEFIPETLGLRESFAATIAATLATLPIIIFGFGRISIISPFVNLLILPFVPYAMLTGGLASLVAIVFPSLGALLAGPAWLFLTAMLEIIQAMAALPFAVVMLPW